MLAGSLIAGMLVAFVIGEPIGRSETAHQDEQGAARISANMKTVCVGRFLVDLPKEAHVELDRASVDGFQVTAFPESRADFESRLARREAEIKAKPDRLGGNRNLELLQDVVTDHFKGKLFLHGRTVTEGTASNGLEIEHYQYEGIALDAMVHQAGTSIDLTASDYNRNGLDNLARLVAQIEPKPENTVPASAGYCVDHAFLRDPLDAEQHESIMMFAYLPSHPDVRFMLILAAGIKPAEASLLQRDAMAEAQLPVMQKMRLTKLRAGERTIGGLSGDEVLRSVAEENGANVHNFWWEVKGTETDVLLPHLVFKMDTGQGDKGPVPSSLSDNAALELWDTISSSIRLHHGRAPKPPVAAIRTTTASAHTAALQQPQHR